jgi:hypothetical protein
MKTERPLLMIIAFLVAIVPWASAMADEQTNTLAVGGDWIAAAHSDSMTDPPDVCIAFDGSANFGIRADDSDVEIRYGNDSWSLPDNVTGILDIKINSHDYPLDVSANTNNQVTAAITDDQLQKLVNDMNVSSSMTVKAGSGPGENVSLDGSNAVITAFLTCAGKPQPGSTGGTNPFGTSSSQ